MTPESIRIALSIKGLSHYRCYNHRHVILFCFQYYAILWLSKSVHNEIGFSLYGCTPDLMMTVYDAASEMKPQV